MNHHLPQTNLRRFTLIELLTVIAVILILIAILLPTLERARYQAVLTVCVAQLKETAVSINSFAANNDRLYPTRHGNTDNGVAYPYLAAHGLYWDDRPQLQPYLDKALAYCPFTESMNFYDTTPRDYVMPSYAWYFGWDPWVGTGSPNRADIMKRLGDTMTYGSDEFDVIAADIDEMRKPTTQHSARSSHPDAFSLGNLKLYTLNDASWLVSFWWFTTGHRGLTDNNYARSDGSVFRLNRVSETDDRLARIPYKARGTAGAFATNYAQLPNVQQSASPQ